MTLMSDAMAVATALNVLKEEDMASQSQPCGDAKSAATEAQPSAARYLPKTWADYRAPALPLLAGTTYAAWHPFKREEYQPIPDDPESGYPAKCATWVPGWRYEPSGPEDMEEVWDGEGVQLRTIVSLHRPGARYPERVFYTRQWQAPNGHTFGKGALRCVIAPTFRAWLRGERWPAYSPARAAHARWVADAAPQGRTETGGQVGPGTSPNDFANEIAEAEA
jgi:hypothetical protein